MSLFYRIAGDKIIFFGPGTYHKRESLKSQGARFNGADKSWVLDYSDTVMALAKTIGAKLLGDTAEEPAKSTPPAQSFPSLMPTMPASASATDAPGGLTISQLMAEATRAIAMAFPNPVWVVGEIQNCSKRGEHYFLDIAEGKQGAHSTATMTVKANIWGSSIKWLEKKHTKERLAEVLVDGTQVRFLVRVSLYKDRGSVSLTVEDIDPAYSQGALALARAELLKKLRSQGLDRKNKALSLPAFPFRVALITATQSRAHTDFEHQLVGSGQFPGVMILIPCPMQGDRVPKAVVKSIEMALSHDVDLIVISRGGGSAADLRWFDGEEIALAIAHAPVPVIAAIGHHADTCVAEDIAHTRQKTPTAAAEFILEIFRNTRTQINEHAHWLARALDRMTTEFQRTMSHLTERLGSAAQMFFTRHMERLQLLTLNLSRGVDVTVERQRSVLQKSSSQLYHAAIQRVQREEHLLFQTANGLQQNAQMTVNAASEKLLVLQTDLTRVDPGPWLNTGWTQLSSKGKPLKTVRDFKLGDEVQARLRDGVMTMSVTAVKQKSELTVERPEA